MTRAGSPSELARAARAALGMSETAWGFLHTRADLAGWAVAREYGLTPAQSDRIVAAGLAAVRTLLGESDHATGAA